MTVDFELYDLKTVFRINEAARLWCEVEEVTDENRNHVAIVESAMIDAIKSGELIYGHQYDMRHSIDEDYEPPKQIDNFVPRLTRWSLLSWAENHDKMPRFLFPEKRDPLPDPKETSPRKNQLIKARCQAVASMLWEQNINYSQKEIAAHPAMRKHGYQNGSYDERTILLWVSEVDPRPAEVRKTPFSKKAKIA